MHAIAAASSTAQDSAWAYLAVFALMVLSFAGIPAIGAAVVLAVGPAVYGAGKVAAGEHGGASLVPLVAGLAIAAGCAALAARYYRRRARRLLAAPAPEGRA